MWPGEGRGKIEGLGQAKCENGIISKICLIIHNPTLLKKFKYFVEKNKSLDRED